MALISFKDTFTNVEDDKIWFYRCP